MTNEQLAMVLVDYYMRAALISLDIEKGEHEKARHRADELKAALDAAIKTLGVKAFISPLG